MAQLVKFTAWFMVLGHSISIPSTTNNPEYQQCWDFLVENMPPRAYGSCKPNVSNKTHQGALIMLPSITKRAYKNYPLGHSGTKFMIS